MKTMCMDWCHKQQLRDDLIKDVYCAVLGDAFSRSNVVLWFGIWLVTDELRAHVVVRRDYVSG